MGEEVNAQSYTREQRQRYREKVRQNLDVFERMLAQSQFEFDRPMTGMEIELNLVDDAYQPKFANAEVLEAIADPGYQTELAPVQHRAQRPARARCPATRRSSSRTSCAPRSTPPSAAAEKRGAHIVAIGILPTIMPEHFEGDWISANNRYTALNDSIFYARGEDIYLDIEGPTGERVATYCDSIAPESACTSVQLHLQVAPQDFAAHWNAAQALVGAADRPGGQLAVLLRQAAARRDPDRAVQPGHRHPPHRAEEPGRPSPRLLRRALDHLDLRPVRGERPLLPGPAGRGQRRGPGGHARRR